MKPEEFIAFREEQEAVISAANKAIDRAYKKAARCRLPANLRPATAKDIRQGAVIWYPRWATDPEGIAAWAIVDLVLYPSDDWKAYEYDGCRYGLDGAFVEVKE
jgi:hypothetical protein